MCTPKCVLPIFGTPLRVLCERSNTEVPSLLAQLLRHLAAHALSTPDVFAQPSKSAATSQLKHAVDTYANLTELLESVDSSVVGSLLKRWLEELPEPLLNWDAQVDLLSACKDEGCIEARIASLNDAVAQVDPTTLGTLKPLLLFLQQYCFRQRRFDQQLLQVAVAFAPVLFPAALAAGPVELRLAEETVATLVSNALHVFNPALAANVPVVTPQALCEAAAEIMEDQPDERHMQTRNHGSFPAATITTQSRAAQHSAAPVPQPKVVNEEMCDEAPYEPYLQDPEFMCSLDCMVSGCVTSALFSDNDDSDYMLLGMVTDDDCASVVTSSSTNTLSSSGGGAASNGGAGSSGGASICSCTSTVAHAEELCPPAPFRRTASGGGHRHSPYQDHTVGATPHNEAEHELPYSPRTELLPAPPLELMQSIVAADAVAAKGAVISSSDTLADLAHREVADGSVICIISAQPGASALAGTTAAAGGNSALAKQQAAAKQQQRHPQQQLTASDLAELHAALLSGRKDAPAAASSRRPTEGGAVGSAGQCSSRLLNRVRSGDAPQRRMSLGGDNAPAQLTAAPTSTTPIATAQQRRQSMGGDSPSSGGATPANGAAAPPGIPIGTAGYLAVSLTPSHTLDVRELSTPDAAVHRLSVRGMSPVAMQAEKERLKRQLKDVAAAYEALAGRPLTPALKEPLRPVYVRYHKIKAMLANGGGSGPGAAAGRREGSAVMGVVGLGQRQVVLAAPPNAVTV